MSLKELKDEKLSVQKVLLHLEAVHGRPELPENRDTVRPLYDWYRSVKQLIRLNSHQLSTKLELQAIPEDNHLEEFELSEVGVVNVVCAPLIWFLRPPKQGRVFLKRLRLSSPKAIYFCIKWTRESSKL